MTSAEDLLTELGQIALAMGTSTEDILARLRSEAAEAEKLAKRRERFDLLPVYYGPTSVAQWCGVGRAAVSNWLQRYDDYPEPAGVVRGPGRDTFFWRENQRNEWIRWARGPEPRLVDWPELCSFQDRGGIVSDKPSGPAGTVNLSAADSTGTEGTDAAQGR